MITKSFTAGTFSPFHSAEDTFVHRGLRAVFFTQANATATIARVVLGVAILPHGAQKLFGWFGGYGFTNTLHWFTETMHVPWILGLAAILAETLGGLALIAGFATRLAAAALGAVFFTAVLLVHGQHGFFINWFGHQKGEGIEYFLLGFALVAIIAINGGGALSVDRLLTKKTRA